MPPYQRMIQTLGIEVAALPVDTTGAAVASDWISMRNASRLLFIISQGAWNVATPAVTLKQATDNAAAGTKALSFSEKWSKVALTGAKWIRTDVLSDTFNLPVTAGLITALEVHSGMLDRANGFDHVQLAIASPGANACLVCVLALLGGLRNEGDPAIILDDPKL